MKNQESALSTAVGGYLMFNLSSSILAFLWKRHLKRGSTSYLVAEQGLHGKDTKLLGGGEKEKRVRKRKHNPQKNCINGIPFIVFSAIQMSILLKPIIKVM